VEHRAALHHLVLSILGNLDMDITWPTLIVGNKTKSSDAANTIVLAILANSHLRNLAKKQEEASH
jgi:CheY-specific phosphatase CheX